jgi:tetratricopeptide (TPR) repeat protein
MDGFNNQWTGYGYSNGNGFYEQLQQYATTQHQPLSYNQAQQHNAQNYQANSYAPPQPYLEVVVPSRPTQSQYQQPLHHQHQYNQQLQASHIASYQQAYQQLPQLDGTANGYPPQLVQQSYRPTLNGTHLENGSSTHEMPRVTAPEMQTPTPEPARPRHDYAQVLLVLADEYLQTSTEVEEDSEEHLKLISFALGCMESVLKNFRLPPLREVQVSLIYAQLLYEKTENYDEAEKALTTAIDLCEGNNWLDLKYSLTLLSAKILFQTKPKAAIKAMQSSIADMATYNHTAWEYAFRYELAMFQLNTATPDLHNAIGEVEKLENLATNNGDKAMSAFAAVIAGLLHLRTCHADAISDAQQAVARLRSFQADSNVAGLPQITIATEMIDLSCSIRRCVHAESNEKRKHMHELWLKCQQHPSWIEDGHLLYIPIKQSSLKGFSLQQGGVVMQRKGNPVIPFAWHTAADVSALELLLGAAVKAQKNAQEGGVAEKFITASLRFVRDATGPTTIDRKLLEARLLIDAAFIQCMEGKWLAGKDHVNKALIVMKPHVHGYPPSLTCAATYLNGVVQQGLGNLDRALDIWNGPAFKLEKYLPEPTQDKSKPGRRHQDLDREVCRNFSILACMNRLFIIDDPTHPRHREKEATIARLGDFVRSTEDRNISAAQMLVHSLLSQSGIWGTKEGVLKTLGAAKAVLNQQIIALVLTVMQQTFFLGLTHEHARKCVDAVVMQARNWHNPTWLHVVQGIQAESLRYMGRFPEYEEKMEEAKESWQHLPEGIRNSIDWQSTPMTKSVVKEEKNG